jgi:hypothetical protein
MKQYLTISQVLLYYDLPQIMICDNAVGSKFISLLVQADDEETSYVCTPISAKRLAAFINGRIDLRSIFSQPEIRGYYTFNYIDDDVIATPLKETELPQDYLPEPDFFLSKKSDDQQIIQEATEKNNAVVHLSLSDKEDSNSVFADNLGDILKYYQMTIENSYRKILSQSVSTHKSLYSDPSNYKLRAFASTPGSFNIHLFSTAEVNLFGGSIIDIALKKFDELLSNDLTDQEILTSLRSVKGHTISSLKNLLLKIIALDVNVKHKWYAPDQRKVHFTYIDKQKAERINGILSSAEELTEEIRAFQGYFEQVDTEYGTWRIYNSEDKKDYSGTCDSGVSLEGITVQNIIYRLICKEIVEELKVSEKPKTKLILISIEQVKG